MTNPNMNNDLVLSGLTFHNAATTTKVIAFGRMITWNSQKSLLQYVPCRSHKIQAVCRCLFNKARCWLRPIHTAMAPRRPLFADLQ